MDVTLSHPFNYYYR